MESIQDRAKKAMSKARKEGRRIYFLIRHKDFYGPGEHFFQGVTRKDYKEHHDAWVQTWVEGNAKETMRKEKI